MPHVKRKRIRNNYYYYLVKNYRHAGKVKSTNLEYLGKEPPSAETLNRLKAKYSKPGTQLSLALDLSCMGSSIKETAQEPHR